MRIRSCVVGVTGACLSVKVLSSNRKAGALAVSVWELSGAAMRGRFRDLWMLCLESPNEYNTIKNKKKLSVITWSARAPGCSYRLSYMGIPYFNVTYDCMQPYV